MNGTVNQFQQALSTKPAQKKSGKDGRYCAPRVKGILLDRILKLGGIEMPEKDEEFWDLSPKIGDFVLSMVNEKVTSLEAEVKVEAEATAKAQKAEAELKAQAEAKLKAEEAKAQHQQHGRNH